MRRSLIFPTALLVTMLALAGCTSMQASDSVAVPGVEMAPELAAPDSGSGTSAGGRSEEMVTQDAVDREVITTGSVTVTVDSPLEAAAEAVRITESVGGRVDGRTESAPINGDKGSATLTLRIPADSLTATLDSIKELGEVQQVALSAVDVTVETQDLDARITALRASVDRLLGLLVSATDTETLIQLETAISDRQGQLESMEAQRRYYADQVSMSTVTLTLVSEFTAPRAEPDSFFSGLVAGWNAFVAFFAGLLVAAGVLLPWLVFGAIIAGVILLLLRLRRRRAAAAAAAAVHDQPAAPLE